ncbi:hypothetical protein G5I_04978 [Acromyrmex echinatior]|uniref:Uncharacterized protein n=1 Tax=Acromyrmex echinatior TaxID=103372 RepID=F4WH25_ACREC|nr:hypothetical protein G5I_04978 [Acromyrmex echinatior]
MANVSRIRYNMVTGTSRQRKCGIAVTAGRAASTSYISIRSLSSCQLFVFESAHIYCFRATRRLVIDGLTLVLVTSKRLDAHAPFLFREKSHGAENDCGIEKCVIKATSVILRINIIALYIIDKTLIKLII